MACGPFGVSTWRSGPPCSHKSWRQRPHGMMTVPDASTQHNAALVEETNATIGQTETRANELDELVMHFRSEELDSLAA